MLWDPISEWFVRPLLETWFHDRWEQLINEKLIFTQKKYVLLKKGFFFFEKSGIRLFKAKENGR